MSYHLLGSMADDAQPDTTNPAVARNAKAREVIADLNSGKFSRQPKVLEDLGEAVIRAKAGAAAHRAIGKL